MESEINYSFTIIARKVSENLKISGVRKFPLRYKETLFIQKKNGKVRKCFDDKRIK